MTKADEGVAPTTPGTAHIVTPGDSGSVGTVDLPHNLARGKLSDYLDGALGEDDRRGVDAHLLTCRACSAFLETLRTTVDALGKLTPPRAPRSVRRQIVERARRESDANQ